MSTWFHVKLIVLMIFLSLHDIPHLSHFIAYHLWTVNYVIKKPPKIEEIKNPVECIFNWLIDWLIDWLTDQSFSL